MLRLISRYSFGTHSVSSPEPNEGLLKRFGITNPEIYRNLT